MIGDQKIVAAHARLARQARRDHYHVGIRGRRVIVRARDLYVITLDRAHLQHVERLALRHSLDDVNQDDITQLFQSEVDRTARADVSSTNYCDFFAHRNCDYNIGLSSKMIVIPTLDAVTVIRFARLALDCVNREYPNKLAHVMTSDADAKPPRLLTPAFFWMLRLALGGARTLATGSLVAILSGGSVRGRSACGAGAQYYGSEHRR